MNPDNLSFLYRLATGRDHQIEYDIQIDTKACTYKPSSITDKKLPWTKLEHQQCSNCPLKKELTPFCPVAVNLTPLLELCRDFASFTEVTLEVVGPERTIRCETTMQRAISSMLGLIMATSPCPHTEFLKPMARFHLPLANHEETIFRISSMYLLSQYFRHKDNLSFSLELDQLMSHYKNLQIINKSMANRLRSAANDDAAINAVILLDLLSQAVQWSIEDGLEEIRYLFKSYGVQS